MMEPQSTDSSYDVKLEIFEGPLDLLLYLIKKQEMDIKDIRISEITQEYLSYLSVMKDLNLEMAGEFLVMAATLMQVKAKMLLPQSPQEGEEGEQGPDPRAELVAKLLEYQKYKEASLFLAKKEFDSRDIYYRNVMPVFQEGDYTLDASLFDLLDAFKLVLNNAGDEIKDLLYDEIPLQQKIREILDLLEEREFIPFHEVFSVGRSRRELIVTFIAMLELIRLKQIKAKQPEAFSEIRIYKVAEPPKEEAAQTEEIKPDGPPAI